VASPATRRSAEVAEDTEVETRVGQLEPERILPIDPGPDRLRRLPVAQVLKELQHRHEGEAPGSETGLTALGVEGGKVLIPVELGERVPQSGRHCPARESQGRDAGRLDGHFAHPLRLEAHVTCPTKGRCRLALADRIALQFADSI
jgi:hypothetical protein